MGLCSEVLGHSLAVFLGSRYSAPLLSIRCLSGACFAYKPAGARCFDKDRNNVANLEARHV